MKKLLLSALAGLSLFCAADAGATAYYANSVSGRDQNPGTSSNAPVKTLAALKTVLLPGDTTYCAGGGVNYVWAGVDSAGSNPTAGGYVAFFKTGSSAATIAGLTLANPYVTIQGFQIIGTLVMGEAGDRCRVVGCTITGGLSFAGADYSTVASSTSTGTYFEVSRSGGSCDRDSISGVTFTHLGNQSDPNEYPVFFGGDSFVPDSIVVFNCTLNEYTYPPTSEYWSEFFRITTNLRWVGNHTAVNALAGSGWKRRIRDETHDYVFERDTVIVTGGGSAQFFASNFGTPGLGPPYNGVIDSCLYNFLGTQEGGASGEMGLWFGWGMFNIQITRTTVLARGHALLVPTAASHNVFDHDTFVSPYGGGVLRIGDDRGDLPALGDSAITMTNCIVKLLPPYVHPQEPITGYSNGISSGAVRCGVYWDKVAVDSAGVGRYQRRVFSHHNLYDYPGYTAATGDNSIMYWAQGDVKYARPGNNTATENACGLDSIGTYGCADFFDSTATAQFDPRIGPFSAAIGNGTSGSDIGAVAYVATPMAEVTPSVIHFASGVRGEAFVYITNVGGGTLTLDETCAQTVDGIADPIVVGYHKPTTIYPHHVAWATGEVAPEDGSGMNVATDAGILSSPSVKIFYDGTPSFGVRYFSVLTNDPSIPISTPSGCAAGHWLNIPIIISN